MLFMWVFGTKGFLIELTKLLRKKVRDKSSE